MDDLAGDDAVIRESAEVPARFGQIFERHSARVYRYLRARVGEDVAGELTGEVFVRAFTQRDRFRPEADAGSALPWLLGIATNLVRMHRRSEARRLRAYARVAITQGTDDVSFDVDDRLVAEGARGVLAAALLGLSPRQRDVLMLHALAELPPAEIAVSLGVAPGTVRSDLHRARAQVAARLAAAGSLNVPDQEVTS